MKVALFDFDGTLYPGQTFNVMLKHLKDHPQYSKNYLKFMSRFRLVYIGYKLKLVSKDTMRSEAMKLYILSFKDNTKEEIVDYFKELGQEIRQDLYQPLIEKVKALKAKNVYTMVISGAYTELLQGILEDDFDHLIGTTIPFKEDKIDTSNEILHMQSDVKVKEIKKHLEDKDVDWANSYAFSDSITDLDMLQLVGNAYAVRPDDELRQYAEVNGWGIISNE
ncbi:HAD family hydrolase [Aliicoccus persicus]|uniref:HAD-superfamily subfamily IB hydrolase, TIGR01490 n=1 Tax=Aliicoccus persicus TaxID=930138 RepID=A0A662Z641_9STAP|nr:HAD-IB family hydrolase [Aliicoccus persicus]SEV95343.1 HAD-superfamily subfamily IB hydrolase, TIGR01490 [Aliicoccus persicus]